MVKMEVIAIENKYRSFMDFLQHNYIETIYHALEDYIDEKELTGAVHNGEMHINNY